MFLLQMPSRAGFGDATRTLAASVASATILVLVPPAAWPQPANPWPATKTSAYFPRSGVVPVQFETPDERRNREQQEELRRREQERERQRQQEEIERRSRWGALAYSRSANKWGFAWNHYFEETARRGALSECGSSDCEAVTFFDSCAAVVVGEQPAKHDWYDGEGDTREEAADAAIDTCREEGERNCELVVSRCSLQ